jgi:hypothetical protein
VPAKVLTAKATEGHAPLVSRKPGMGESPLSKDDCTRTGREGVKIALNTCRVNKKMPVGSIYGKQPIRLGDQAAAGNALVSLCAVSTDYVKGIEEKRHISIPGILRV